MRACAHVQDSSPRAQGGDPSPLPLPPDGASPGSMTAASGFPAAGSFFVSARSLPALIGGPVRVPSSQSRAATLLCAALAACSPEVDRVERVGTPAISEERVSCTYAGYCVTCGITISMEMECGLRFFLTCPGTQRAVVSQSKIIVHYKDGSAREDVERVARPIEACS